MNFNEYTVKSQEAVQKAQQIAQGYQHPQIEVTHILKGILEVDENVLPFLLKKLNVNTDVFKQTIDSMLNSFPKVSNTEIRLSNEAGKMLNNAMSIAKKMKDEFVSLEHLILAIFESKDQAGQVLKDNGITKKELVTAIENLRQGNRVTSQSAEETYQSLDKFALNLNAMASDGKLDPVIGRDDEIRRVLQILSRRSKNNPILIGEPGVG
jgi:ATP-dependent Clp protease ATP-binding subunit ClpB